jgi:acetyl-CoA acetyltransferase
MGNEVFIAGVDMTPFRKPGHSDSYDLMGAAATRGALRDAGIDYADIQQAFVGFVLGDSGAAQQTLYHVGQTGIPIVNCSNACASGGTALFLAFQAITSGAADCVLALGFEQMQAGALGLSGFDDRPPVVEKQVAMLQSLGHEVGPAPVLQFFSLAGDEYAQQFGVDRSLFAHIPVKSRRHARDNSRALFRDALTVEEVLASPKVSGNLHRFECCPPTSGAAAAVLVSGRYARQRGLSRRVELSAVSLRSDDERSFSGDMMNVTGYHIARDAAREVYERAGIDPLDLDVVELNDNFASNEVIMYEALGLCPQGGAARFISDGDNTYSGQVVTNPSGGLLSKGHPIGASGLAQCAELTWQLREQAGSRQVPGARLGLQQIMGFISAGFIAVYARHGSDGRKV